MYELDAIAACRTAAARGVVTGVIIFTVIDYGLAYIGVNPYWQYIIKGAILIFAVALDSLKYARKKVILHFNLKPPPRGGGFLLLIFRW